MLSSRWAVPAGVGFAFGSGDGLDAETTGGMPGTPPIPTGGRSLVESEPTVNGSWVNPVAEIFGAIEIGTRSYVAGNTILYAADGRMVSLGDENNVQDNVYVLAREADVRFADSVSLAHHAIVENSTIGAFTFFGFRSRVRNAVVEAGAMVMHGATVEGVTIRRNTITPIGATIVRQEEADALPTLDEASGQFKHQVQAVNLEFVEGYSRLYRDRGRPPLEGVGPNPITSWNPVYVDPQIGADTTLAEFVRIVGDVRLGEESAVGQRTAMRADEGTPIVIGRRARIQSRTTFHALKGTRIDLGENAQVGADNVIHGPVAIGDNFASEDGVIVFRATVENNVTIRQGAIVAGRVVIREGAIVPERAVVTTQEEADALPRG
ncbi:MAG: hypothetical protein QOF73_3712 [Thermomicrobiales bacterium]|nr:hypothetical protein [Thermomicrobiales bacterium]